jgi:signal peptidase I
LRLSADSLHRYGGLVIARRGVMRARGSVRWILVPLGLYLVPLVLLMRGVSVVDGPSMLPTIPPRALVWRVPVTWPWRTPRHGDVVIVDRPWAGVERIVKRVSGVPGDCVSPKGTSQTRRSAVDCRTLGPDEYFIVGDNGLASRDSRRSGAVGAKRIIGRVTFVLWPIGQSGPIR